MLQMNDTTLAPGLQSRLNALSLRLEAMGFPAIGVASGRRSKSLQESIFRDRYQRQDSGSGPYGDVRWWDGDGDGRRERWVRVKAGGTVLPPGDSTHEDPPATGVDLAWPYNNRGTAAHAALVEVCEDYGIRWTGVNFGEDWHFDSVWDAHTSFAAGEARPFQSEGFLMALSDDEQRELLKFARNFAPILEDIRDAIGAGNARNIPEQDKANRSLLQHARVAVVGIGEIMNRLAPVERVGADGQVEQIPLRQEIADAKTLLTKQDK